MSDQTRTRSDFIEKIGLIAQAEGLPRIAGRVFGLLIFDGGPVSFADLASQLQVSRGSISSATRLLEDRGVIKRVALPGERRDYFQTTEQPFAGLLEGALKTSDRARDDIQASIDDLPREATEIRGRLQAFGDFYGTLSGVLRQALHHENHEIDRARTPNAFGDLHDADR